MRKIQEDRLEQSRIRLERDIDKHVPYLSSLSLDNSLDDVSSVDFARHNSQPPASFHSFEHLSHLDSDFYSRHGDGDSIALDPDLGHTMSTAAHHASALTLSAGLCGRGNYTTSGVEFDPERPLQAMLDPKVADDMSLFDLTRSKSKSARSLKTDQTRSLPNFDPVVVDSTAELDHFLQTGHHRSPAPQITPPCPYISRSRSQAHSIVSDVSDSENAVPRLSQALGRQFSPKRPRSAPVTAQQFNLRSGMVESGRIIHPIKSTEDKHRSGLSKHNLVNHQQSRTILENNVPESQFFAPANVAAHETETPSRPLPRDSHKRDVNLQIPGQLRHHVYPSVSVFGSRKRHPFTNIVNQELDEPKYKGKTSAPSPTAVRLPDVTGLSSAVQSPIRGGNVYASADVAHPSLAVDLLPALDALQMRLQALERENGVSHRRVKELESELEECKIEVAKERARIRERERELEKETYLAHEHETSRRLRKQMRDEEARYRDVVGEKKALEALVATLRKHLARVTSELASHKSLIASLRTDAKAVEKAWLEVEVLRAEVDRLACEVQRLKEIVEEGLQEMKGGKSETGSQFSGSGRDRSATPQMGVNISYVTVPVPSPEEERPLTATNLASHKEQRHEAELKTHQSHNVQWEPQPSLPCSQQYIQPSELARVEYEMRERRSERSLSATKSNSGTNNRTNGADSSIQEARLDPSSHEDSPSTSGALSPVVQAPPLDSDSKLPGSRQCNVTAPKYRVPSTPFPQIRGSRMERLFFSAPEHNVRTCTVCHRRKHCLDPSRIYQDDNERCNETGEEELAKTYIRNRIQRTSNRGRRTDEEFDDRLPPQTVLARVLRELEDDFSHYKAIYLELAEQYGMIDAVSNIAKRNVLASHLQEVIDTLEHKGDQIASLYDLLNFQDKPLPGGIPPQSKAPALA